MICTGRGENREYCDRVMKDILERYDDEVCGKTTNQEGDREHEVD